jgi:hypothetical protein
MLMTGLSTGARDSFIAIRKDQKRRIESSGHLLHRINVRIENFLTNRENPLDFCTKPFGAYKKSEIHSWSKEVLCVLKKSCSAAHWTEDDARERLQILCTDKGRNYKRQALERARAPDDVDADNDDIPVDPNLLENHVSSPL